MPLIMQTVESEEGNTPNVIVKCLWLQGSRSTVSSLYCRWEVSVSNSRIKTEVRLCGFMIIIIRSVFPQSV